MLLLASGCAGLRGDPFVVRDAQSGATIVVADTPSATAEQAAEILRDVIAQMTGQTLAIVAESEAPADGTLLAVGSTAIADGMGVQIPRNPSENDQYVIRRRGRIVVLAGNDGGGREGSIYAVYDLLQRWGCGWYASDPDWQVIPRVNHLRVPDIDVRKTAAFDLRRIRAVAPQSAVGRAWRLGGALPRETYTLNTLVPRKLRAEYPDWFDAGQPDICHPEVIEHVVQQFKARLEGQREFLYFDISLNDTYGWPDTQHTRAIGNPGAQGLFFATRIADGLRPVYEDRFAIGLCVGGLTHAPPPDTALEIAPEVTVFFAHEGNRITPWDAPDTPEMDGFLKNQAWIRQRFHGWHDTGVTLGIHDYWMPGTLHPEWHDLPWIALETTVRNARYWHRYDVRYVDIETDDALDDDWLIRWPLYYIGARTLWDPSIDPDDVLLEACAHLFGPAAQEMFAYYKTLERAMFETPYFQQDRNLPAPQKVYTLEIMAKAGEQLAVAAERTGSDERIAARISRETEQLEKAAAILEESPRVVYRAYLDDKFMFWHEPEATVGTIRRLFGISPHVPLYIFQPDADDETRVRKADTIDVIKLTDGTRLLTETPDNPDVKP